jgi:hypothetical protein
MDILRQREIYEFKEKNTTPFVVPSSVSWGRFNERIRWGESIKFVGQKKQRNKSRPWWPLFFFPFSKESPYTLL